MEGKEHWKEVQRKRDTRGKSSRGKQENWRPKTRIQKANIGKTRNNKGNKCRKITRNSKSQKKKKKKPENTTSSKHRENKLENQNHKTGNNTTKYTTMTESSNKLEGHSESIPRSVVHSSVICKSEIPTTVFPKLLQLCENMAVPN